MSAAAFAYIEPFQAKYLVFQGRAPRNLAELALTRAELEHRQRLTEIRRMAKKLALLDPLLPAIAAAGVNLHQRRMWTLDEGKSIRVSTAFSERNDDKLHQVLLGLGFKEVARTSPFSFSDIVTLKHGRALLLQIEVSKAGGTA